jgi:hypothetical protein
LKKKQALLLLSLLTLIASLYWVAQSGVLSEKVRISSEVFLTALLDQPVTIKQAALTLFSPSVRLTGIASPGTSDRKTDFSAKEIRLSFSLWSLLTQSFVVRDISIQHPEVSMDHAVFQLQSKKKSSVIIRRIRINDGIFSYKANGKSFFLPQLNATISPDFRLNRFDVTLSGKEGHLGHNHVKKAVNLLTGRLIIDREKINFEEMSATLEKMSLKADGVVALAKTPSETGLDMRVNAIVPIAEALSLLPFSNIPTLSGTVKLQGRIQGVVSNPRVAGDIALLQIAVRDKAKLTVLHPIGSLRADFLYENKTGAFKNISAKLFSGEGTGEGEIVFSEAPFLEKGGYHLKLQYDRLALHSVMRLFVPEEQAAPFEGKQVKGYWRILGEGPTFTTEGDLELASTGEKPTAGTPAAEAVLPPSQVPLPLRLFSLAKGGKLEWAGTEKQIRLHEGTLSFSGGTASFPGHFNPGKGVALEVRVKGDNVHAVAQQLHLPVIGPFQLTGQLSGFLNRPFFSGDLELQNWALKEHPLGLLQSRVSYLNKTILFQKGSVKSRTGEGVAVASGIVHFGKQTAYYLTSGLSSVNPQEVIQFFKSGIPLTTTATGKLFVEGEGKQVKVTGPLTVGEGVLYGESFKKGRLHLTVTEKKIRVQKVRLEKAQGVVQGDGEISYQGEYVLDAKTTLLPIQKVDVIHKRIPDLSGDFHLTVRGKGRLKNPHLKSVATVARLQYREAKMESGTLYLDWKEKEVTVLSDFPAEAFALSGKMTAEAPYPFSFQSRFDVLPIHTFFNKDKQDNSKISVHASGAISGKGTFKKLKEIDLTSDLASVSVRWKDYELVNNGPILFRAKKGVFAIEKAAFKGTNTHLALSGGVTPFKEWGLLVKGDADLNLLQIFTPRVQSGRGVAHLDLKITDPWKKPKVQGVLSLKEGVVYLAEIDPPAHIASLSLVFNQHLLILETVEGKMGAGRFSGRGKANFVGLHPGPFGFHLDLTEMPVQLTRNLTGVVGGVLLFQGDEKKQSLNGTLHIQKGLYNKRVDLRQLLLKWRERQEERLPIETPFIGKTALNIHLYGKENIWVDNNVAKVALDVDLQMKGTIQKPLLFGQINIPKGTFHFRTNEFKMVSGVVEFVHPTRIDPVFDIRGESKVRDYHLDLSLKGVLSEFDMTLSSLPPLPGDDILSLLAVGKITREVTEAGDEARTFIVADMVSGFFAEPIKQLTGLDRIFVGAAGVGGEKSSKNTLISAEKRLLNDRLLVVYSKAIDPSEEDRIHLFYDLAKNVSLAGSRDEEGQIGGDLRFRFEFR